MKRALRPIGHEDRLSLVDHLDELRSRLIISGAVLVVAFGFCFWQNNELLRVLNKPLTTQTQKQVAKGEGTVGQAVLAQQAIVKTAEDTSRALEHLAAPGSGVAAGTRGQLGPLSAKLKLDVAKIPRNPSGDKPVTLTVGEPFTTTLTVALYFALIISLPVILYELFGFILPALSPHERRAAVPLLAAVPALFVVGVAFGYFIVLPAAVRFFVNFNAGEFNVLIQANQFYKFAATILLAMGLVFQVPVVILGATRARVGDAAAAAPAPVRARRLRRDRRVPAGRRDHAAARDGTAVLLFEASILLAAIVGRRPSPRTAALRAPGARRSHGRASGRRRMTPRNQPCSRSSTTKTTALADALRPERPRPAPHRTRALHRAGRPDRRRPGGLRRRRRARRRRDLQRRQRNESSGSASFAAQIKKYDKLTKQQPSNTVAWENLAKALLHEAGGEGYVGHRPVTGKGKELFSAARRHGAPTWP